MNKDIKCLVKELKDDGWSIEQTRRGHYKARHPVSNKLLSFSSTPSCKFAVQHIRGDIRRIEREMKNEKRRKK